MAFLIWAVLATVAAWELLLDVGRAVRYRHRASQTNKPFIIAKVLVSQILTFLTFGGVADFSPVPQRVSVPPAQFSD